MQFVVHHEFTQTSRGFSKKRGFVFLSRVQNETFGNLFFLKQEKVGFKSLAQLTSYIDIYVYIMGLKWKTVV